MPSSGTGGPIGVLRVSERAASNATGEAGDGAEAIAAGERLQLT
ncbi:hypothetical protein H4W31_006967 [Plantactinospora soyae]|uniref:Uncharacterized protein n=1 Tax=Plantactinospora soyae TaxID=1544732 RepID=A0A927MBD1_9ACTN|nr:hypothetical protein [Plantactinospora soyae]